MKLIKRSLIRGEQVTCKNSGGILYTGVVKTLHQNGSVSLELDKEIRTGGGYSSERVTIWNVKQNASNSWDGCYENQNGGWYSRSRIFNHRTYGSWLYSNAIEDWSKELM